MFKKVSFHCMLQLSIAGIAEDDDLQLIQTRIARGGPTWNSVNRPWDTTNLPLQAHGGFCPQTYGMDCSSSPLSTVIVGSVQECCDKCYATEGCGGYAFEIKKYEGHCHFHPPGGCDKPDKPNEAIHASGSIDRPSTKLDYLKCPVRSRVNCPGNDLSKTSANSAGECCDICHANPQCAGYKFNTKQECFLKTACQNPIDRADDVISAGPIYRKGNSSGGWCPNIAGLNCPGNDLSDMPLKSIGGAGACCDACHGNSACNGFIYNANKECWLKNTCQDPSAINYSIGGLNVASDVVAGGPIKRLNHRGLYCPAIKGLNCVSGGMGWKPANSTAECCDMCYSTKGCGGYVFKTFFNEVSGETSKECWMKDLITGCDNPSEPDKSVIAAGPIQLPGYGWGASTTTMSTTTEYGASTDPDPTVCPGTDSPGEDTEVVDADCFDAEAGFGPGFTCANTEAYCSADSGDGLTVGECCPSKCKKEFENKKKKGRAEGKRKNDRERGIKRKQNESARKKAETERKKKNKDKEWGNKRDDKETKNKNTETERKNKRGFTEKKKKKERNWKKNKMARRAAANKRAEKRNKLSSLPPSKPRKPRKHKKGCLKKKKTWDLCAKKVKCEKRQKKKGCSPPNR